MPTFHKKTRKQMITRHVIFFALAFIALGISIAHMLYHAAQPLDIESVGYENILQTKIMWFRLKFAAGLIGIGLIAAYSLFTAITYSPLGKFMWVYAEQDTENMKASKTLSMGIVFSAFTVGIFWLLASVIGGAG